MSHRKVCSQGSIPFSWEDSPGVSKSKVIHQDSSIDTESHALDPSPMLFPHRDSDSSAKFLAPDDFKIPPPPCPKLQLPRRSASVKGFRWWQEDPFLAAYKECTKNVRNGKLPGESKKLTVGSRLRKSKLTFSCKNSCDVQDDNLVRLSNLPSIRRDRISER